MRLRTATGAVILLVWVATATKGVVAGDYKGFDLSTPVMVIFAGFMFGDQFFRRRINGASSES